MYALMVINDRQGDAEIGGVWVKNTQEECLNRLRQWGIELILDQISDGLDSENQVRIWEDLLDKLPTMNFNDVLDAFNDEYYFIRIVEVDV